MSAASVHVARQPILDARQQVYGYELLHRADAAATAYAGDPDRACALVLENALTGSGLDLLCDGRRAFLNLTEPVLRSNILTLLPPEQVVLEVLESITVTPEIVAACVALAERGYALALDDFVEGSPAEALLPHATFAKIDVLATPPGHLPALASRMLAQGVSLVAEKVETQEAYEAARAAGCSLFQGYYFCRPQTISRRRMSAGEITQMRLLATLMKPAVSLLEVETLLKQEAALSLRVLRSVNSAAMGLRREIHSIREALVLLGLDQLRKWASLWTLAGLNQGPSEVLTMTVVRARACEALGQAASRDDAGDFLLGLCSLLDTLLGQPMRDAIADLPLSPATREALLGRDNEARCVLTTVVAYERGDWDDAAAGASRLGADPDLLPSLYMDALAWARQTTRAAAAA